MRNLRYAALTVCILAALTLSVDARYNLEVKVLSFSNPSNTDRAGQQCDSFDQICEYIFRFCLSLRGSSDCIYGVESTTTYFITASSYTFPVNQELISGSGVPNPVVFPDAVQSTGNPWPGGFNLRTNIEDYDHLSIDPNDPIDVVRDDRALATSTNFTSVVTLIGDAGKVTMKFQYRVMCQPNYHGANCFTFCRPRDDSTGHYTCDSNGDKVCLDGYTDESNDCITVVCDPSCVNGQCIGPNTCSCSSGWSGPACDQCVPATDCPADRGTCTLPGECNCNQGYSGMLCQNDDDVCGHTSPCANGATCNNNGVNEYLCTCPVGYTSVNCDVEIDGCDPSSPPCENEGTCTHTGPGQFNCTCPPGWTGTTCEENIDECNPTPPCVRGTCSNCVPTGPVSVSDPSDPDTVMCIHGYICNCPEGFFGDNCETEVDYCDPSPCENGGVCHDVVGGPGYSCICPSGFTGENCDVDIDECEAMPCQNGGNCTDQVGYYNCSCPPGFLGNDCEINIDDCQNSLCSSANTHVCVDGPNSYTCVCLSGYTGQFCDVEVDNCVPNPCQNGMCTNVLNDFQCDCDTGFTGVECDVDIDYCINPEVCLNSGTCVDGLETYTCHCTPSFTGQQCETPFNPCSLSPCSVGEGCVPESSSAVGYLCEDCSLLQEDPLTACSPSIVDPDSLQGNTTAPPTDGPLIGGVIGGLVGALMLLLLLICLIVCCVRCCACCCVRTKEQEAETEYQNWTGNGVQDNPLYFGTSTLVSNQSGTLPRAYGSTSPPNTTYEALRQSSHSSSVTESVDLGPMQNPMYAMSQLTFERNAHPPSPPPRNGSAQGDFLTEKISLLPPPSSPLTNNHYETIPAHKNDEAAFLKSGTYDSLTDKPSPTPKPDPSLAKSGKYDSLSALPETPGAVENPYVLPPQRESQPELAMSPSDRGDMYVMLPPAAAFASLKEEAESEKELKKEAKLSEHNMPQTTENPYEYR